MAKMKIVPKYICRCGAEYYDKNNMFIHLKIAHLYYKTVNTFEKEKP